MEEIDDIYDKEITKRYDTYELKRLATKRKNSEEGKDGDGKHFKLDVKNRFLMLLVYYRLYMTYTLAGFLFNLDQSNICRHSKIESMIRKCVPIPQKIYKITKRLRTPDEIEKYFPGFMAFIDSTEQPIPGPGDKRKKIPYYSGKKKMHTIKTPIMANNHGIIIHKIDHKKGHRPDYIYKNIKRIFLSLKKML